MNLEDRGASSGMRLGLFSGLVFFSGIAALIFETLWLRLSGLAFGNSIWAAALILSSFMAGLGLGNALAASSKIRRWRPLHLYAVLEILVAVLGCTIVFGLPVVGVWLRPLWQGLWNFQPTLLALRFVVSFLILLVPTTAMGLTLPVLIEDPILRRSEFGRAIGFLYGANTLGAVVGALVGEVWLIGAFGLRGTSVAAGLMSCVAATIALVIAKSDKDVGGEFVNERAFPLRLLSANYRLPWRLLIVSFGTGCMLLCLEVIWFRFLRLYVASYSVAFAIMLAVVLLGIGSGGVVSGLIHRQTTKLNQFVSMLLLLAAIAVPVSYLLFPGEALKSASGSFNIGAWPQIVLLCLALMFPASFLSGILFPAITARVQGRVEDRMNSTGITTLFNTTGAAVGPLLASFVLLPKIGFQSGLLWCAAGYAVLAFVASERSDWSLKRGSGFIMVALSAAFICLLAMFPYQRAEKHFQHAAVPYEVDVEGTFRTNAIKRLEGSADTWQLLRQDLFGQPYRYRLLCNAISMSGTSAISQRYMRLFAYLPLTFRPESQDVLLMCYGCGVTADAFLHGPQVKRMDVVDISREVFALADFYSGINYSNPLRDSRVHPIVQDGRFFLQASPRQYDVISGEPPPPRVAGAVNLYTQEFFSLMSNRLKPGGIATFWLPLDQLTTNDAKVILRAFHNAFPNSSVWGSADPEWIMMGIQDAPRSISKEELEGLWRDANTRADLARIGIEVPEELAALFLMSGADIDGIDAGTKPLTDFYPKRLSDITATDKSTRAFADRYLEGTAAAQRFSSSPLIRQILPDVAEKTLEPFFTIREMRYRVTAGQMYWLAELDRHLRGSRLQAPVLEALRTNSLRVALAEKVADGVSPTPVELLPDLIAAALARRDFTAAIKLLEEERAHRAATRESICLLTYLYCLNGNVQKAESIAPETADPNEPFVQWLWGKLQAEYGFRPPAT